MLTKSQARTFFLGGTGVFTLAFLALTADSMQKIPNQTKQANITPQVAHGKQIWEDNNCMGCHTLFGEGAYYAPELTKAVDRRGKPWLQMFLRDPEAMFPGERKMVNYHFTSEEVDAVIAFLEWCGNVDLNGFPAKPTLRITQEGQIAAALPDASASTPHGPKPPEIFSTVCSACHAVHGKGGVVGPALDDVHKRINRDNLISWISDPQKVKPGTTMPKLPLSQEQVEQAADYILSLGSTR